jgi:adenosylhomocysteine nucleosidase
VIAALEIEARTLEFLSREPRVRVYVSGPGPLHAGVTARNAIADGAGALLAWGMAGALRADGESGDVIVPARVLCESGEWATDAAWRRRIAATLAGRFEVGDSALFSAVQVFSLPQAKRELGERTGAAAVDMESAAVAKAAADAGLPCIVIRVIADRQGDALPEGIESLLTADGRTRHRGLWPLLLRPRRIPSLLVLARRSVVARRVLREVAGILGESPA